MTPAPSVAAALGRLAAPLVDTERFGEGLPVLAYDRELQLWKHGTIQRVHETDDGSSEYDARMKARGRRLCSLGRDARGAQRTAAVPCWCSTPSQLVAADCTRTH